jgi:L,D-peptidoglycan transpeptidase YkuD (ErfK/YbiS/YcfS/YnhG family)
VIFTATSDGRLDLGDRRVRAALGPAGVKPAADKREGDLASQIGRAHV